MGIIVLVCGLGHKIIYFFIVIGENVFIELKQNYKRNNKNYRVVMLITFKLFYSTS